MYWSSSGIDPSLLELKHLYYLDLSFIDFQNASIPTFIGEMKQLQHLDLSRSSFSGRVPPELGNLTNLRFLDMGFNDGLRVVDDHMEWIYNLSSLTTLGMSYVNLKAAKALNLMNLLNSLPILKSLDLVRCEIHDAQFLYAPSNSSQINNPASLETLDLSDNSLVCWVPSWIGNITSLTQMDLADNQFHGVEGGLLSIIGNTCRLRVLDLSNNNLHGNLGNFSGRCSKYDMEHLDLRSNKLNGSLQSNDWLGKLKNMKLLHLSNNSFSGPMPEDASQLRSLEELRIEDNYFEGVVSEVHFANLSKLSQLMIGNRGGSISWKITSDWVPPFNLYFLSLQNLNTNGSEIPQWIRTQTKLWFLDLSYGDITGTVPTWLGELTHLTYLDLSNNQLKGSIPQISPDVFELYLARNQINGSLSTSFCKMTYLVVLDISQNRLWGAIPDCWSSYDFIIMRLSSNQLSGVIPASLNNLHQLQDLQLRDNNFHGQIPSLENCSYLMILDLGGNQLSGNITKWVGDGLNLRNLIVLSLRQNQLNGNIPSKLCGLGKLRILDVANNNITGTIPPCRGYLPGMMGQLIDWEILESPDGNIEIPIDIDKEIVVQVMKGREFNYSKTVLKLFVNMDPSDNKMVGFIPVELTQLTGLIGLNSSHNNFSGMIPSEIGRMKELESLDLSCNNLFGPLPNGMLNLTSLEVLNLSYNNFSGRILEGNQFSTLNDPFSYIGNPYLCGDPLPNSCDDGHKLVQPSIGSGEYFRDEDEDDLEKMWLYTIIMSGFACGFWGVIGVLIFKRRWRYAYFQFAEDLKDHIYVKMLVNIARLKKLLTGIGGDDE
ncbi:LRR receptor-like serine/threonine-protein kinase GSO1 [Momordica charantia]|uniref:LRR receptor-like serine/threonine-protein kinase GSO1 n=1 Tax=Momordica charantia TaxID=3673 RepID=A0A6J1E185_MOMCH|nr:LRR receptor-like serine/threonine-protein kinase GSO1 [Momordica charantia]